MELYLKVRELLTEAYNLADHFTHYECVDAYKILDKARANLENEQSLVVEDASFNFAVRLLNRAKSKHRETNSALLSRLLAEGK